MGGQHVRIEEPGATMATWRTRSIGDHQFGQEEACLAMSCPKRRFWGSSDACYSAGHGQVTAVSQSANEQIPKCRICQLINIIYIVEYQTCPEKGPPMPGRPHGACQALAGAVGRPGPRSPRRGEAVARLVAHFTELAERSPRGAVCGLQAAAAAAVHGAAGRRLGGLAFQPGPVGHARGPRDLGPGWRLVVAAGQAGARLWRALPGKTLFIV